jgi:hypothetical protein
LLLRENIKLQPASSEKEAKPKAYAKGNRWKHIPMIGAATTVPSAPEATVIPITVPE